MVFIFAIWNWKHCFWLNLVLKLKNSQFKSKYGTKTNCNMLNLKVVSAFFIWNGKHSFRGNLLEITKKCQFTSIFGTETNSIMLNLMVVFQFSYSKLKTSFLGKFGSKNEKNVTLSWNFPRRIILRCWI